MGYLKNPFTKEARPPPPEWQTTKHKRPEHIEHAPSAAGVPTAGSPGFGDTVDGQSPPPQHEHEEFSTSDSPGHELSDELVQVEGEDKMSGFCYLLASAASLSGLLFGYDTGIISGALVNITTEDLGVELNATMREWIASATSVGALFGALMGGYLVDRLGRKWVLAVGDVWFVIGAVLIASSYSLEQIIVGRLILGLGVGIAAAITPIYLGELAPSRFRGRLVSIQSLAITGGQVIAYALGAGFTFRGGWRALFAVSIVPAAAQAIFIHWLPESPRFDLLKNRVDDAHKTLSVVYPDAAPEELDLKIRIMQQNVRQVQAFQERVPLKKLPGLLFSHGPYRRAMITASGLMFFQQFAGFNTLLYYSATIFSYAGFDNPTAVGLIIAGTNLVFTGIGMFTMDRVGKRRLLLLMYPIMILGLALTAVAFNKMTEPSGGVLAEEFKDLYEKRWTSMMIGCIVLYTAAYASGIGNLGWHGAEMYPLEIRGYGTSILTAVCWASNIVVSATFLTMLEHIGATATFGYYAGLCFLGLIFVSFCYPETKQLSLEDCSGLFQEGFGIRKSNRIRREKVQARRDQRDQVVDEMDLKKDGKQAK